MASTDDLIPTHADPYTEGATRVLQRPATHGERRRFKEAFFATLRARLASKEFRDQLQHDLDLAAQLQCDLDPVVEFED